MTIKTVSSNTSILYFEQIINEKVLDEVQKTYQKLKELEGIIDLIPSYASILIIYDTKKYNHKSIETIITNRYLETIELDSSQKQENKLIKISTDYSQNLDLQRVATHNNLTIKEVIELHTKTIYRVYTIGFMVGFAYLASIDPKIITPRVSTPRAKIPKGSVAIADSQTAIYPKDSAGGWNIIGHTDFDNFDRFCVGDRVQFISI